MNPHVVGYLEHIISDEGVRTDPEKISAVKNWSLPEDVHQLQSFLGLCTYYRKFVKGFSSVARPLHKLTEDKQKFLWTDECEESFRQLKEALTSSPLLAYPQPDKLFILDTDAIKESAGAVLSQEIDDRECVIAESMEERSAIVVPSLCIKESYSRLDEMLRRQCTGKTVTPSPIVMLKYYWYLPLARETTAASFSDLLTKRLGIN
ncbi:retrovirus-related Pol polyprotein from transposon opus [Nephila pilipes]|uniref:RNA-directed DNA polymerase n=1 Tax=Nephila pilipes TaxID=299642 RepID=A0A8X6U4L0_NEPPI|nr:retrovirus-related Pol polyprotein from transposon opus [Nephila pilipes]